MPNISNQPGNYPAKIIAADLGGLSDDGSKPALKLTYQDGEGNTLDHLFCLWGQAGEISMRNLDKALAYKFEADPKTLVGRQVDVVTEDKWNEQKQRSYYGVKYLNAPGGKALAKPAPNLLAQLAARAKALPPEAPRPPRAPGQTSAPRPPQRPSAPGGGFADDDSVPF